MLGLAYPGGPSDPESGRRRQSAGLQLPRAFLGDDDRLDFSFSGLEDGRPLPHCGPGRSPTSRRSCSNRSRSPTWRPVFRRRWSTSCWTNRSPRSAPHRPQEALRRRRRGGQRPLPRARGGRSRRAGIELYIAPLRLCTDNAMMGAIAIERYKAGLFENLDLEVYPGLVRKNKDKVGITAPVQTRRRSPYRR